MAYGPGADRSFYLYRVEDERVAGLGTHIVFPADREAAVVRAAGRHPDISADYYGAVLLDPDGDKLEVVAGLMN